KVVLTFHRKRAAQRRQDLAWIAEIRAREGLGAQNVHDRDGEQGCADAVGTNIQQVNGEVIRVEPVIAEGIPAQLTGRNEAPVGVNFARQGRRQEGLYIGRRFGEFGGQMLLTLYQRTVSALLLVVEPFLFQRTADARAEQDRVEWLGQIILGASLDAAGQHFQVIER